MVGACDTRAFEARCEADWWPSARARHPAPDEVEGLDALFLALLAEPIPADDDVVATYPSHLQVDLLPPYQGRGWGQRLLETLFASLRAAGSTGVHLGVAEANHRAIAFYERLGMVQLGTDGFSRTYALRL